METQAIQQAIGAIEQATDQAVEQLKKGQADAAVKNAVNDLHQQARTKRALTDAKALVQAAMEIEQAADKAIAACRAAGQVDPALQQAVKDAHQKASQLKHQVQGTPT
ncbi:hypothetical protein GCM10007320_64910 [Pseudorhodoferax aquiterrae]|uniref:Uncharacterized protein n=1 Tax=Pseudorhodoferax aquiterrae TaxID=747304 RepID=A0ABQ3GF72_9BURK|nr:hypothetical protein [Pseudorhodoferax aquiterrae]GHD04222.1 hypothetical protein GCM10007320_64910 [Pseudorhodoferax aquiterrae]